MKKLLAFILVLCVIFSVVGCTQPYEIKDLSRTASIIIRVYSDGGQTYTEHHISERESLYEVCKMFTSLEAKQIKSGKEIGSRYYIEFLNNQGVKLEGIAVISNVKNAIWVDSNNVLYEVISSVDVSEFIKDILAKNGEIAEF